MKKIVLWGAGYYGRSACSKMRAQFEIICFVDNNAMLVGETLSGIPVVSAAELKEMYSSDIDIVICAKAYFQISAQLIEMGIHEYYVMMEGFLYHNSASETMLPVELSYHSFLKKEKNEKSVLYVQDIADRRTNEVAAAVKKAGYRAYLLYMLAPQETSIGKTSNIYDGEFTFYTADGMINFIENSDFDIVHNMGSSAILSNIVRSASKPVVLDIEKDQCGSGTVEDLFLEYTAVTQCDGIIYGSPELAETTEKKYKLHGKETICMEREISGKGLCEFYEKVLQRGRDGIYI